MRYDITQEDALNYLFDLYTKSKKNIHIIWGHLQMVRNGDDDDYFDCAKYFTEELFKVQHKNGFVPEVLSERFISSYEAAQSSMISSIGKNLGTDYFLNGDSGVMVARDKVVSYAVIDGNISMIVLDRHNSHSHSHVLLGISRPIDVVLIDAAKDGNDFVFAINILLFKKLAEIQTQFIAPKAIRKSLSSNEPIANRCPFMIKELNVTWFTTYVRDKEFGVRGHFRMQPCGTRHSDRRLTYIKPFTKHGYTRRARKLLTESAAC